MPSSVSYEPPISMSAAPTVCKRLDLVNELLGNLPPSNVNRHEILEQLERGEITAKQAAQLLKGR